jgi:hypothetical protein
VVTGDAIFASRRLSAKILQAKGDYLWVIKENQSQMYQEIQTLFEPQQSHPGWSAPPMDFRWASSVDKGHGRLEKRHITVSSLLASMREHVRKRCYFAHPGWYGRRGRRLDLDGDC